MSKQKTTLPKALGRFLAQAIQLEEQGIDNIIRAAIYFSFALFIAAIIWASVTEVNEVTVAKGQVVPKGYIHNIQHLEGGIVSDILIRNGDTVKAGQLLIKFAAPASQIMNSWIFAGLPSSLNWNELPAFSSSGNRILVN